MDSATPLRSEDRDACLACGAAFATDANFCRFCGAKRGETRMPLRQPAPPGGESEHAAAGAAAPCPACGHVAHGRPPAPYCRACGQRIAAPGQGGAAATAELAAAPALAAEPKTKPLRRLLAYVAVAVVLIALLASGIGFRQGTAPSPADRVIARAPAPEAANEAPETTPAPVASRRDSPPARAPIAPPAAGPEPDQGANPAAPGASTAARVPSDREPDAPRRTAKRSDPPPSATRPAPAAPLPAPASGRTDERFEDPVAPQPPAMPPQGRTSAEVEGSVRAARTIDELFRQRTAAECAGGLMGFVCRERIRFGLCEGKWSNREQPGMSTCHVMARAGPPPDQ